MRPRQATYKTHWHCNRCERDKPREDFHPAQRCRAVAERFCRACTTSQADRSAKRAELWCSRCERDRPRGDFSPAQASGRRDRRKCVECEALPPPPRKQSMICSRCRQDKPREEYAKYRFGLAQGNPEAFCKACVRPYSSSRVYQPGQLYSCATCKEDKPGEEFYRRERGGESLLLPHCKSCAATKRRERIGRQPLPPEADDIRHDYSVGRVVFGWSAERTRRWIHDGYAGRLSPERIDESIASVRTGAIGYPWPQEEFSVNSGGTS